MSSPPFSHETNITPPDIAPPDAALYPTSSDTSINTINPDNPPYGFAAGAGLWVGSIAILFIVQIVATLLYFFSKYGTGQLQAITEIAATDATLSILVPVLTIVPSHLLQLALAWVIVTGFGKRPFLQTLGWHWTENFGLWKCLATAIGLLIFGALLSEAFGGQETQLDKIVASGAIARLTIAFAAALTAPLVEEVIYRGVLFPTVQRKTGTLWAIIIVATLFTLVHVGQYITNFGVITAVGVLSFAITYIRARTGSLLPCVVIHTVFNSIQAVFILLQPYLAKPETAPAQPAIQFMNAVLHAFGIKT